MQQFVNANTFVYVRPPPILPKGFMISSQHAPWEIQADTHGSCLAGGCCLPGGGRKGWFLVGATQHLLLLTFGPWSKRPALSGVNIKWWTFSSRAALYFCCQTAGAHRALIGIHRRLCKWLWGCWMLLDNKMRTGCSILCCFSFTRLYLYTCTAYTFLFNYFIIYLFTEKTRRAVMHSLYC